MDDDQDLTLKSQPPQGAPEFFYARGEIAPGTVVAGRYKVRQKLGEGGMAVVYLVEQIFLHETLALKVLTAGLSDTSTVRFQKEAKVCRLLDHPNLIKVVDFALLENEAPYLVMEFIDGESLADVLKRRGQLSEAETIEIFMQIMDGLAYAHEQNVIHRDLKPSNVMLFQGADKQLQVKILDFGIAKMTGKDTLNTMTLTGTGEIFGSPLFMSPEQCLGRTVDLRSDLYSIGCALYQVLTGAPPFAGDSALATMMLHLEGTPLPLKQASLGKVYSPAIEKVTMKLLQKLPDDRYQSARDVYEDLEAIQSRRELKEEKKPEKVAAPKRKVSPVVLGMVALCLVAAGTIVVLFLPKKVDTSTRVVEPQRFTESTAIVKQPSFTTPFAAYSISDWNQNHRGQGKWTLKFPSEGVGKIALAGDPLAMDVTERALQPAQGLVSFERAGPLMFTTPLHEIKSRDLLRFRADEVRELALEGEEIRDDSVEILSHFNDLESLFLDNCVLLTNKSLPSIFKLNRLVYLRVKTNSDQIDSTQLGQAIAAASVKAFLATYYEGIDALCAAFAGSEKLAILRLEKCDLTRKGLADIAKLPNLENLQLLEIRDIHDESLAELVKCKKLKALYFHNVGVTVDSFQFLKKLPSGCRITFQEIGHWSAADQKLYREAFPNGLVP